MTTVVDVTHGFWPTADQELLLRASLLEGATARAAFEAWASRITFTQLDGGSVRLLPLLYQNLQDQGIDAGPALSGRLRGVHRQSWYKNQLLLGVLSRVLDGFTRADVPTLLLKGVPLALGYYQSPALRPMIDADILIPFDHAARVLQIARDAGLTPRFPDGDWPPRLIASKAFRHRDGWEFDIHVNVMHECRGRSADDAFWARAVPLVVGTVPSLGLSAEDLVLHVLAHGVWRNPMPPVRWVSDVVMVLRRQGAAFDWYRLWEEARARRLSLVVGRALRYLRDRLDVAVPAEVLSRFQATPVGVGERFEYRSRLIPGAVGVAAVRVSDSLRARGRDTTWQGPFGFVRYLRDSWSLESSWGIPLAAGGKTMRRLKAGVAVYRPGKNK